MFIRMEVQAFSSYKQFLTQHLYKPFLHFTQAFIYFRALNSCVYISPAFIRINTVSQFLTFDNKFKDKIFKFKQKTSNFGALKIFQVPYGGKLWHHENLVKLMTDQKFAKVIYSDVLCECNAATSS